MNSKRKNLPLASTSILGFLSLLLVACSSGEHSLGVPNAPASAELTPAKGSLMEEAKHRTKESAADVDKSAAADQPEAVIRRTSKPSAPILFASTYDGAMDEGVLEQFELQLTAKTEGELRIRVLSPEGLLEGGQGIEVVESVLAGQTVSVPVEVFASNAGKYYLTVEARLSHDGMRNDKAFALALYVGAWNQAVDRKLTDDNYLKSESTENVIVLPVTETVTQQ